MWGSPGLLLIADAMLERTGEPRWASAWSAIASACWASGAPRSRTSGPSGSTDREEILGPAHGLAGVVARSRAAPSCWRTSARAGHDGGAVGHGDSRGRAGELAARADRGARDTRVDDPHAVVSRRARGRRVARAPADAELDALLLAGRRADLAAGPLRKGAGLCHGTAGNGLALLGLFARTGDEVARPRAALRDARHPRSTARREHRCGRHSLWTGDLGVAMYLHQCLAGGAELPAIELW